MITTTTVLFIPEGLPHSPFVHKKVDKPFLPAVFTLTGHYPESKKERTFCSRTASEACEAKPPGLWRKCFFILYFIWFHYVEKDIRPGVRTFDARASAQTGWVNFVGKKNACRALANAVKIIRMIFSNQGSQKKRGNAGPASCRCYPADRYPMRNVRSMFRHSAGPSKTARTKRPFSDNPSRP